MFTANWVTYIVAILQAVLRVTAPFERVSAWTVLLFICLPTSSLRVWLCPVQSQPINGPAIGINLQALNVPVSERLWPTFWSGIAPFRGLVYFLAKERAESASSQPQENQGNPLPVVTLVRRGRAASLVFCGLRG